MEVAASLSELPIIIHLVERKTNNKKTHFNIIIIFDRSSKTNAQATPIEIENKAERVTDTHTHELTQTVKQ